jgi:hypothetical protein
VAIYQLFRIKVERAAQRSLFEQQTTSADLIRSAIESNPSFEIRAGYTWRIGNVEAIDEDALFFALGRITKSTIETYDDEVGAFINKDQDHAPYTFVLVDLRNQVCAIARKAKIAQSTTLIASNLVKLLSHADVAVEHNVRFVAPEIRDPREFIAILQAAYSIKSYEMTFGLPNPFDVEEDFHRPMENLLQASNGKEGKTLIKGDSLQPEVVVELASSAAAAGSDAKARVQMSEGDQVVPKTLKGNPATANTNHLTTIEAKKEFLAAVRELYSRIRGKVSD